MGKRDTQHKLLAIWQISVPTMGKRDTQHKLLAIWQISVPTMGKRDSQQKLLATWQISVPTLGNTYPAQVTGILANICTYIGPEGYPAQVTGNLAHITILDDQFVVVHCNLIFWIPNQYYQYHSTCTEQESLLTSFFGHIARFIQSDGSSKFTWPNHWTLSEILSHPLVSQYVRKYLNLIFFVEDCSLWYIIYCDTWALLRTHKKQRLKELARTLYGVYKHTLTLIATTSSYSNT